MQIRCKKMVVKYSFWASIGLPSAVAMAIWSPNVYALDFKSEFNKALQADASYQAALAERQAGVSSAGQARSAYLPEFKFDSSRLPSDTSSRDTFTLTQPILSVDRWVNVKQYEPRLAFAEANLLSKRQDLAMRLLKASNAIVIAKETIKLNQVKIEALNQQALRAKRLFDAGQGTLTDLRDIEVKAAQAKAQDVLSRAQLQISVRNYQAIVGESPNVEQFVLHEQTLNFQLSNQSDDWASMMKSYPPIQAAEQSLKVAELDLQKAKGAFAPQVNATTSSSRTQSATSTTTNSYTAIAIVMPLSAGSFYGLETAQSNLLKSKAAKRQTEDNARLELERLRAEVASGADTLRILQSAISAAELSVEANTKSYQGGVRSSVDVINAIQTLYQVKMDFATSLVKQSENILGLLNMTHANAMDTVDLSSKFVAFR